MFYLFFSLVLLSEGELEGSQFSPLIESGKVIGISRICKTRGPVGACQILAREPGARRRVLSLARATPYKELNVFRDRGFA